MGKSQDSSGKYTEPRRLMAQAREACFARAKRLTLELYSRVQLKRLTAATSIDLAEVRITDGVV